jgi:hypothetical protein
MFYFPTLLFYLLIYIKIDYIPKYQQSISIEYRKFMNGLSDKSGMN